MGIIVVNPQFVKVGKMFVATLAIWVARTLNPMFFQPLPGWKVLGASMADVVTRGIGSMLFKN